MNISNLEMIKSQMAASIETKQKLFADEKAINEISAIADVCVEAYKRGNKVLWCGNGGSAADAQHMAGELVSKFRFDRPGLPSMSLSVDPSIVTAISNDYGYEKVFSRQIQANGRKGDVLIGISTSGNSKNIVEAGKQCVEMGITTVALVGAKPCAMDAFDHVVKIPSTETPRIQECQTLIGHILCGIIEERIFGEDR
jgi:D-sedoheptulose 7-phosphate isomerase